jgi:bacillithiol system protein YtxJ
VIPVRDEAGLEAVCAAPRAVLFKHSTRCGTSAWALRQAESYERDPGAAPVYLLDVVADPALARLAAERLAIPHASPQAIVLVEGRAAWHASHGDVTREALVAATTSASSGSAGGEP